MENRPQSAVVETRIDVRCLASIALYFIGRGYFPRSKSELIRMSLENFYDLLVENDKTEDVKSSVKALEELAKIGIVFQTKEGRLPSPLAKQLQREALSEIDLDVEYMDSRVEEGIKKLRSIDNESKANVD